MPSITVSELYVDGVQLPTPALEGITFTSNKIWSSNTGRLEQSGLLAGTIVTIKKKLEIKWPPLSWEQVATIENTVSTMTPFHTLTYTDMTGATTSMTVYFGDPKYTQYSWAEGRQFVLDVAVSAIEQ